MNQELANRLGDELIRIGKDFKAGNSTMTEDEAIDLMDNVTHIKIGREAVCDELNVNNSKFYELINLGKIPKGRKQRSFKELCWYRDEIRNAMNKLRHKN